MAKKFSIVVFTIFLSLFVNTCPILAVGVSPSPIPSQLVTDSYTLFWPITPGVTIEDKTFFIKEFKEKIIGIFISGEDKKAEYQITLGTKRLVESEKLLKEKKADVAARSLEKARTNIASAKDHLIKSKDKSSPDVRSNIQKQLENLIVFLPILKSNSEGEVSVKIEEIQKDINALSSL